MYLSALKRLGDETGSPILATIASGRQGTYETLRLMAQLVREYKRNPTIRDMAIQLTSGLDDKDYAGEVRCCYEYVRDNIRYQLDVADTETLHTPDLTLEQLAGDCDDKATLLCSLLESIGHKTRLRAVGFAKDQGEFSHVLADTKIGQSWIPLETTEKVDIGWTPPNVTEQMIVYC